ncbi:MAG: hypothetical protein CHACPFDD_03535 [Phycisphaerae bacterium]|nr:hypothetical protein [Phycisphaerae bacterium]
MLITFLALMIAAHPMFQDAQPNALTGRVVALRCEYLVNPLGIDVQQPRLFWQVEDGRRGVRARAYQLLVASSPETLAADTGDLWDSGRVESGESIQIVYAGKPLAARARAFWKVRAWLDALDTDGRPAPDAAPTAWSEPASWTMGLLDPADWKADWIGDATSLPDIRPAHNGYHSQLADAPDVEKTVTIDLGQPAAIDAIRLHPARPFDWKEDAPGFLFPLRFRIDVADDPAFAAPRSFADRTAADVNSPGEAPLVLTTATPVPARFVRLTVTRLREQSTGKFGFALAELEVLAGGSNAAAGKTVLPGQLRGDDGKSAPDTLERNAWSARHLVDGDLNSHRAAGFEPRPAPYLRSDFALDGEVRRATLYASALGLYEMYINGSRVGQRVLAPEWTDYTQRVQYQTYDVTALVKRGSNAVGAILGDGWYAGEIGLIGLDPQKRLRGIYGRQPQLLAQLEVELTDGRVLMLASNAGWKSTLNGPIRANDLLDGETYDAERELGAWSQAGYDAAAWTPVRVFERPAARLVSQSNEPITAAARVSPVARLEPKPKVFVFDLGQNMVGWCHISVVATAGDKVRLRYAEVLNPDGTIYTDNLRGAAQTDTYYPGMPQQGERGRDRAVVGGVYTFEPRFTYHGFRYVEISGARSAPRPSDVVGICVNSAAPLVGDFECSDPLLNHLWRNILWTQRANLHSTPTDCPQRDERMGWMGDILAFAQTGCFNMDMAAFFTKWLQDVRDAQLADGRYPDFAPQPYREGGRFCGVPAWGDAGVFVPWVQYVNYGDRRLLEQHFDSARRWVDWIHAKNPDLLWKNERHNDYGDWLNADTLKVAGLPSQGAEMPKDAFATAFFARSTELVAKMAGALGRAHDEQKYAKLAADIRTAFNAAYVKPDGEILGDTQAGYAIALNFDLLPESLRAAAVERMIRCFERYDGHISTGFHSTICLMNELTRAGRSDEAYRLIMKRTMPSWGYAIDHGATTIWERWDGFVEGRGFQDPGMNSFAHYALGSVGEWMYRTILGINPDPAAPGFARVIIRPEPGGGLRWARGTHRSIRGPISVSWRLNDAAGGDDMTLDVSIPPGVVGEIVLPTTDAAGVREGDQPLAGRAGVRVLDRAAADALRRVRCEIGGGSYRFTIPHATVAQAPT